MAEKRLSKLIDTDQNFWCLASIQGSAIGLPAILIGNHLTKLYGIGSALTSIIFGNLILWVICIGIIGMSSKGKTNAIQNVKTYLGNWGAFFVALVVILAYVIWYAAQIELSLTILTLTSSRLVIIIGVLIGLSISVITMKGIKIIKWTCLTVFPFISLYLFYLAFSSNAPNTMEIRWQLSGSGIITTVAILLPGIINIPTFFRHSRSLSDSVLGLSFMSLFFISFQILGIFANINPQENHIIFILNTLLISTLLLCANMANIYFASAGWEMIFPAASNPKKYLILGMVGTGIYISIQQIDTILFIANLLGNFLATLGVVLLIDFIIRLIVQHRPRPLEKNISFFCWIVGCAATTIAEINPLTNPNPMLIGILYSALTFLFILFIEETLWSIRHLKKS